jgi:two-component system sensor histidine kinase FlrB
VTPQQTVQRRESLETAFNLFNQLSAELTGSYRELQLQVLELSQELAAARNERMQQLAEKEQLADRLERLLETLPAAVIVLDRNGKVREFNPAAVRLFRCIELATDWDSLLVDVSLPRQPARNELHLRDGKILSLSSSELEQVPGRILVLLDVTETRRLQQRLMQQERLSAMGQMSAQLAHQMRTPLSSALLYVSHLAKPELNQAQRERFTAKLRARLLHMERQIGDILLFARGDGSRLEALSLAALVEEFADSQALELSQAGVSLEWVNHCPSEPWILGREDALQGVLSNLTENALQHAARHILISLHRDEQIRLRFEDDGAGIPPEVRSQLFEPFFTTRSEGTGLGLAVVQNLLLSHNAEIHLMDAERAGAAFELVFPPVSGPAVLADGPQAAATVNPFTIDQARSLS